MHLTLCADDDAKQPKPIIIFLGTGKNVLRSSEVQEWDSRVSVLFQPCAWIDTDVANKIVSLYEKILHSRIIDIVFFYATTSTAIEPKYL